MLPNPESLSNELLAAQCIMPRLVPRDYADNPELQKEISELIQRGIGGFCVFQGEADPTALLLHQLQLKSEIPLLFSADYEHGLPMRLEGGTDMPHAMSMMQAHDPDATKKRLDILPKKHKQLGFIGILPLFVISIPIRIILSSIFEHLLNLRNRQKHISLHLFMVLNLLV